MDFVRLHGVETVDEHASMELQYLGLQYTGVWANLVQSNNMLFPY
jgi:hypothetical protein